MIEDGNEKETLKRLLESRFKYYCSARKPLSRDEHHKIADALVEDLLTNEWSVLKAHLKHSEAQGFYRSKEMSDMLSRGQARIEQDIFQIYPLEDAIVHALVDTREP